jgi:hypothetical protein
MAVRAHDLALLVEGLVAEVVELDHDRIRLRTIDTGVLLEERHQVGRRRQRECLLALARLIDVPLAVRCIVPLLVGRSAEATEAVALIPTRTPPRELLDQLSLAAVSAALGSLSASHERMFP